jgi:hypothetical protein
MDFTFKIDVAMPSGIATVYTDDLAEFIAAMDCQVLERASHAISDAALQGLPVLAGYIGPRLIEYTANGAPVIQYRAFEAAFGTDQRSQRYAA